MASLSSGQKDEWSSLKNEEVLVDACIVLENSGNSLEQDPDKTFVLKLTQERIKELAKSSNDEDVVLLDYFLRSFNQRLWFNLMIDFPYEDEKAKKIRIEVLDRLIKTVGNVFKDMSSGLGEKDKAKKANILYDGYKTLANSYENTIRALESLFEGKGT